MDWDNLKFFLALAETGSLSRASEKLRVDHSTVARRIDMLEQELGPAGRAAVALVPLDDRGRARS